MLRYILRRLAAGVLLLLVISFLAYTLLVAGSGDVARKLMGINATQEQVAARNEELGLNRPILAQYGDWLRHAVTGDFGTSWFGAQDVTEAIRSRLSVTLTIVLGAVLVAAVVGVVLGIFAATRGGALDRAAQGVGLVGFAIPGFLIAFALISLFSIRLGWFRATGYVKPSDSISEWAKSITLPIVSLALASLASVTLQVRGAVKDTLGLDYVRTLRSRGLRAGGWSSSTCCATLPGRRCRSSGSSSSACWAARSSSRSCSPCQVSVRWPTTRRSPATFRW